MAGTSTSRGGVRVCERHDPDDFLVVSTSSIMKVLPGLAEHVSTQRVSRNDVAGDFDAFTALGRVCPLGSLGDVAQRLSGIESELESLKQAALGQIGLIDVVELRQEAVPLDGTDRVFESHKRGYALCSPFFGLKSPRSGSVGVVTKVEDRLGLISNQLTRLGIKVQAYPAYQGLCTFSHPTLAGVLGYTNWFDNFKLTKSPQLWMLAGPASRPLLWAVQSQCWAALAIDRVLNDGLSWLDAVEEVIDVCDVPLVEKLRAGPEAV